MFLSEYNQISILSIDFHEILQYQISYLIHVMRADGRIDAIYFIGAFRDLLYANAPKKEHNHHFRFQKQTPAYLRLLKLFHL
jgi:hypothetical protein